MPFGGERDTPLLCDLDDTKVLSTSLFTRLSPNSKPSDSRQRSNEDECFIRRLLKDGIFEPSSLVCPLQTGWRMSEAVDLGPEK